jgi:rubrerythrin
MPKVNERALRMLAIALEMEQKGKAFYEKAIAESGNPLGREIFGTLRADEIVHVDRIKAIYSEVEGGGSFSDGWSRFKQAHAELTPIFRDLARRHGANITAATTDIEALDIGIDFERKSVSFYEEQIPRAEGESERRFLERMVAEEKGHEAVLVDMRQYLSNPSAWFAEHERSGLDGA